jgi:hypothetical protein
VLRRFKEIFKFFEEGGIINYDGTYPFKDISNAPETVVKVNYVLR